MIYKVLRYLLLPFAFLFLSIGVQAQDVSQHEKKRAQLEKEIALIDRQLKENVSKQKDITRQLQLIRRKINNREQLVYNAQQEIVRYGNEISVMKDRISATEAEMDTLLFYYEKLVRTAYRNRDSRLWFAYIFGGEDISEGLRRYSYFKRMSQTMDSQARQITQLQQRLDKEKSELETLYAKASSMKKEKEKEIAGLQKEEKSAAGVEKTLKNNRRTYEKQIAAKKKEVEALNREIKRLVELAMKDNGKTQDGKKIEVDYKLSGEFSKNKGNIPWPTESQAVIEGFGQHYHPVFKGVKLPYNYGINVATERNAEVRAVFDGVVKQIVVMPGYNQCVLVQHGDYFTFYCKLGIVNVKAGQQLKAGDLIGNVDTINGDTIFHFQIWKGQDPQNPEMWLR